MQYGHPGKNFFFAGAVIDANQAVKPRAVECFYGPSPANHVSIYRQASFQPDMSGPNHWVEISGEWSCHQNVKVVEDCPLKTT
jgi:hypothetical protein